MASACVIDFHARSFDFDAEVCMCMYVYMCLHNVYICFSVSDGGCECHHTLLILWNQRAQRHGAE